MYYATHTRGGKGRSDRDMPGTGNTPAKPTGASAAIRKKKCVRDISLPRIVSSELGSIRQQKPRVY